ncbi:hypothetical protein [Amycolatopsis echigonensis]|nr:MULTISPECIES: hypothetical protein [Amycolatopsis]
MTGEITAIRSAPHNVFRETRAAARERHGWIMDTYLLRRPE